jgi:hypothetical protein
MQVHTSFSVLDSTHGFKGKARAWVQPPQDASNFADNLGSRRWPVDHPTWWLVVMSLHSRKPAKLDAAVAPRIHLYGHPPTNLMGACLAHLLGRTDSPGKVVMLSLPHATWTSCCNGAQATATTTPA